MRRNSILCILTVVILALCVASYVGSYVCSIGTYRTPALVELPIQKHFSNPNVLEWVNYSRTRGKTVGFLFNQLDFRGTGRGVYNYCLYVETYFKATCVIFVPSKGILPIKRSVTINSVQKFTDRFKVVVFNTTQHLTTLMKTHKNNMICLIRLEGWVTKKSIPTPDLARKWGVPIIFQAIFSARPVSHAVVIRISNFVPVNGQMYCPVVPRIIGMPVSNETWHEKLGIPLGDVVMCRHGGYDTFDDVKVRDAISRVLVNKKGKHVWFLFLNTPSFGKPHKQKIHFPPTSDDIEIKKFINTCDAMIYGRLNLETFGQAIAEFSSCNKPILLHSKRLTRGHHADVLGEKGAIYYSSYEELQIIMYQWNKFERSNKDYNSYQQYAPLPVMRTFYDTCIAPYLRA